VLYAYRDQGGRLPMPSMLGEANYERENNTGGPPTTDETLRRQMLWSLTSGAAGYFYGSSDWQFHQGWEDRLDTAAVSQLDALHDWFVRLEWWSLVPDDMDPLVIDGRGQRVGIDDRSDVLDNDYVTAARTANGSLAVIYVPSERTISLDMSKIDSTQSTVWVDPADPSRTAAAKIDSQGRTTTPGKNVEGDGDWLLLITA